MASISNTSPDPKKSFTICEKWTKEEVLKFLRKAGLEVLKQKCQEREMDGANVKNLTDDELTKMRITGHKEQQEILNVIKNKNQPKLLNDPIHGSIELHPLLVRIIDTPQFQRLRNLKQLGVACYVYPGACHTRFEHSIGVAHLAGELAKSLKTKHNDFISEEDILCVQIAGLCHDLGHGPFSHLFDDIFLKKHDMKHEELSVKMFDHLVEQNNLKPLMRVYGVKEDDLTFIKEMIDPKENNAGRPVEKSFLYEILSNKTSGIDVDKFDYFARDCHHMGIKDSFDHHRYLKLARLCVAEDGKKHISIRDKEVHNLYAMFHTRYHLHKRACQHKVKYGIDLMVKDALEALQTVNIEGESHTIDDVIKDMKLFTKLTDCVFDQILNSEDRDLPQPTDAKKILERILSRDLYKCLGETQVKDHAKIKEYKKKLIYHLGEITQLEADDLEVLVNKYKKMLIGHLHEITQLEANGLEGKVTEQVNKYKEMLANHLNEITQLEADHSQTAVNKYNDMLNDHHHEITQLEANDLEVSIKKYKQMLNDYHYETTQQKAKALEVLIKEYKKKLTDHESEITQLEADDMEVLVTEQIKKYKEMLNDHHHEIPQLKAKALEVVNISIDYGMKDVDPVENMYFYTKSDPDRAIKIRKEKVSPLLPVKFSETVIRVYWKRTDKIDAMNDAKEQFRQWCRDNGLSLLDDYTEERRGRKRRRPINHN